MRAAIFIALALAVSGCDTKPQFTAKRSVTSTVAIGVSDTTLVIDSVVPLEVHALPSERNAIAMLDATVTASTSTRAMTLAAAYQMKIDTVMLDGATAPSPRLTLPAIPNGSITGTLVVTIPSNLNLAVQERGGTALFDRIGGAITVISSGSIRANGVTQSVSAMVSSGNAIVAVQSGSPSIHLVVDQGDIDVLLPAGANVVIDAIVNVSGQIVPSYPGLPMYFGMPGQPYHATLGGNGAPITLSTNTGNILIEAGR